ncbi:MAG TPA: MoxR family ATPase [Phycisphaerae bacterium]|nr:MoxR family ATPase [Phycisphaerae bacterium]HSA27484.1 MoxR family ATPase [Phycisphaerae bacterium]
MNDPTKMTSDAPSDADLVAVQRLRAAYDRILAELSKVIVGQDRVLEELLIALFAGGHCILEGVPGLAKTLMISTLARSLNLTFSRIQFTPDLMPSDITGTEVIQEDKATGSRAFKFLRGPVFANVVLADEINRTPPKTQAALLEAMQERQVTVGGSRHVLTPPFFVLATQNPIEQEGTYPLPEAQQDRFMFKVFVGYPTYEEELRIAEVTATDITAARDSIPAVLDAGQVLELQDVARRVPAARHVVAHALDIVRRTRPGEPGAPEITARMIKWGAGPRAVQFLVSAAKARAVLHGQYHVSVEDIRAVVHPVLRHRIVTTFSAEAEGYSTDRIVDELLSQIPPHQSALTQDGRIQKVLGS